MILSIKPAVRSHISEIVDIFETDKREIFDKYYFGNCILRSTLISVMICDKVVRGVVVCNESKIPDACEISALYISKDFQRIGFGKKLLSHALREMRAKRYRAAYLWVNEKNNAADSFFTAFGFEYDGKLRRDSECNDGSNEKRYRIDI